MKRGELKSPVLPDGADSGGVEVGLAGAPAAGVEGEEAVNEGGKLRNVVGAAVKLLMAEAGIVEKTVDDCNAMVPRFNEKVCCCECGHG